MRRNRDVARIKAVVMSLAPEPRLPQVGAHSNRRTATSHSRREIRTLKPLGIGTLPRLKMNQERHESDAQRKPCYSSDTGDEERPCYGVIIESRSGLDAHYSSVLRRLLKQNGNAEAHEQRYCPEREKRTRCLQNASCKLVAITHDPHGRR
jgi:hypothetical protein